jgi:uncharacterized protein (DUF1778 family)
MTTEQAALLNKAVTIAGESRSHFAAKAGVEAARRIIGETAAP